MTGRRVVVLYEDKARRCFGLHKLLVSCAADDRGLPRREADQFIDGRPLGGNAEVIKACQERFTAVSPLGLPVVAQIDSDRVRTALRLNKATPAYKVIAAIEERCPQPALLTVVLLESNAESIVASARVAGVQAPEHKWDKALGKSGRASPEARDGIFDHLAFRGTQEQRSRLREHNLSFDRLVKSVAKHLP